MHPPPIARRSKLWNSLSMRGSAHFVIASLLLSGCVTRLPADGFASSDTAIACIIAKDLTDRGIWWATEPAEQQRLRSMSPEAGTPLPERAQCNDREVRFRNEGFGTAFHDLWVSPDRSRAVIGVSVQLARLNGRGGECHYERRRSGWVRIGCLSMWMS